jgi:excisionase family DNA binding protein
MNTSVLTVKQAAHLLGVHDHTIRRRIVRGEIRHLRVGGLIRIPADELVAFLSEQRRPVRRPSASRTAAAPTP